MQGEPGVRKSPPASPGSVAMHPVSAFARSFDTMQWDMDTLHPSILSRKTVFSMCTSP